MTTTSHNEGKCCELCNPVIPGAMGWRMGKCLNSSCPCHTEGREKNNGAPVSSWREEFDENWKQMFHKLTDEDLKSRGFKEHNSNLIKSFIADLIARVKKETISGANLGRATAELIALARNNK